MGTKTKDFGWIRKEEKKGKGRKGEETNKRDREREREKEKQKGGSTSFQDLRKPDRRFSSEQKAKSVHASRAARGYQNLGVLTNSKR